MLAQTSYGLPAHPFGLEIFAQYYFVIFGLLTFVGGIIGFRKAASLASLLAGGISGAFLAFAGYCLRGQGPFYTAGEVISLVVSLLLLGRFTPALVRGKVLPAVYIVPLAAGGVVLAVLLLLHARPV